MTAKTERHLELLRQFEPTFASWADELRVPEDDVMRIAVECVISRLIETLEIVREEVMISSSKTVDRSTEARSIEAKPIVFWTDADIAKLAKAYAYASGVSAMEGVWSRILMSQRYDAQREEELRATIQHLTERVARLEKEKTK